MCDWVRGWEDQCLCKCYSSWLLHETAFTFHLIPTPLWVVSLPEIICCELCLLCQGVRDSSGRGAVQVLYLASFPGSLLDNRGKRKPGNLHEKSCQLLVPGRVWRYHTQAFLMEEGRKSKNKAATRLCYDSDIDLLSGVVHLWPSWFHP